MDAHAALELGNRSARVHRVYERLHRLVAAGAEERRAQDAPRRAIRGNLDVDLQEPLRLALLDRPRDTRHRPLADARA